MSQCRLCGHEIDVLQALAWIQRVPDAYENQVIGHAIEEINRLRAFNAVLEGSLKDAQAASSVSGRLKKLIKRA